MFEPLVEDIQVQIDIVEGFIAVAKAKGKTLQMFGLQDVRLELMRARDNVKEAGRKVEDVHALDKKLNKTKVLTSTS